MKVLYKPQPNQKLDTLTEGKTYTVYGLSCFYSNSDGLSSQNSIVDLVNDEGFMVSERLSNFKINDFRYSKYWKLNLGYRSGENLRLSLFSEGYDRGALFDIAGDLKEGPYTDTEENLKKLSELKTLIENEF